MKKICIIYANCQGEPLAGALNSSSAFAAEYDVHIFTNYIREEIPASLLQKCSLFLYQHLGEEWGALSSKAQLRQLPQSAVHICIPNFFSNAYWPLWSGAPGFNYRDRYLDELIDNGMGADQILVLYLKGALLHRYNIHEAIAASLEREKEKEKTTPIKYIQLYEKYGKTQPLFRTVNHPRPLLLAHAARKILEELGADIPAAETLENAADFAQEFELPIHPVIAKELGLAFADAHSLYNVYGTPMTFRQYTAHYIACRQDGQQDFIGYLNAVTELRLKKNE